MSEPRHPPSPDPGRAGWLTGLMILIGVVLLLPGICAGVFVVDYVSTPKRAPLDSLIVQLWLVSFAIAAGGIGLIWWALRRPSS
jgi:hypothetical protein